LEVDELKAKFDPSRHPDVLKKVKTIDETRFSFLSLLTLLLNTNSA